MMIKKNNKIISSRIKEDEPHKNVYNIKDYEERKRKLNGAVMIPEIKEQ